MNDELGLKVLRELNSYHLGFTDQNEFGMNFLCDYYSIDFKKYEEVKEKGKLLYDVLCKINNLYRNAVLQNDRDLLQLFETGLLRHPRIRNLHREWFLSRERQMPLFCRADSVDLKQFIEFHIGLKGTGYIYVLRKVMEKYIARKEGSLFNFARLKALIGILRDNLERDVDKIIFYHFFKNTPDVNFFLNEVFSLKITDMGNPPTVLFDAGQKSNSPSKQLYIAPRDFYSHFLAYVPVFWNPWLQKLFHNHWYDTILKYSKEKLAVEPPPNLLLEQKIALPLINDARFKDYFTEKEKNIFPESYIIKEGAVFCFDKRKYSLQDLVDMPRAKRSFIVKYAGLDLGINWGGKTVYRIKNESKKRTEKIIKKALLSYEKRKEPWIVQKDISLKENIRYFDSEKQTVKEGSCYRLYRPYFLFLPCENKVDVFDILVLFRDNFKVHAKKDSVIGIVS